ncbi:alginate lyase family protein [Flavobacterium flavipallidum]|uniref:Alginate lyase family protein n=1 Tax=Flavobacterium flavipallidum TaxID=3139140 RepID=A0ABU9HQY1_9FLAO
MKKIFYFASLLLVGFVSCTKEEAVGKSESIAQIDEVKPSNPSTLKTSNTFVHPGTVLTQSQMQYAYNQAIAGVEPYATTFTNFQTQYSSFLSTTYTSHAHTQVGRNLYKSDYENDAMAVFVNGIMWNMTGSSRYADKAIELLDSWSSTLTSIQYPDNDWQLCVGYGMHFMVYGADMIYNYTGFTSAKKQSAISMFNIMYNCMTNYAAQYSLLVPFVRDGWPSWGASQGKFLLALGVFSQNLTMYNLGENYFKRTAVEGADVGTIPTAFLNSGQPLEAARDQFYVQLGLASFLEAAQISYNQGSSSLYDSRSGVIGKAIEYTAKYNLGNSVTWTSWTPATSIWGVTYPINSISSNNRGLFRPIWYLAYNYYHNYRGMNMPYTAQVINNNTVEGTTTTITDQVGWGSLFFNNSSQTIVAPSYTWSGVY